ncbi:hypothetical protein [Serratia bockelmannii]|uniref:hypothetical protein n=1 Tax=Serratia bockelmannii TaxID=2703793 RepID=UPI0036943857
MTEHTAAAQSADPNPLSDEYVNAVIQRHGYQSTEAVCARLYQWIGLHGGENGVTLLIYEAHKVLSKLRAPVADELVASLRRMASVAPASECEVLHAAANALASAPATNQATSEGQNMFYEGLFEGETERQRDRRLKWMKTVRPASAPVAFYRQSLRELVDVVWNEATESTAVPDTAWADRLIDKVFPSVLASAPVAGDAQEDLAPPKCPITGRPFFMALEHPELGWVPTYGGPYDSYTIPHLDGKADQPWHERELCVYRYDHDLGGWRTDEVEVIPLRIVHEDVLNERHDAAPQASEAVRDALKTCGSKVFKALAAIVRAEGPDTRKADDPELIYREPVMDEAVRIRQAYDELSAALSAQPGAQSTGGSDA